MNKIITTLSFSKVGVSLQTLFLENSDATLLIVSSNIYYFANRHLIEKIVYNNDYTKEYPLMSKSVQETLDDFLDDMKKNNVRIGIISLDDPYLKTVLDESPFIFTTARNTLNTKYLPHLEKLKEKHLIISVDNDEQIIEEAKKICQNNNIGFCKAVIHCVVPYIEYSDNIVCYVETPCSLYIPPEAYSLSTILQKKTLIFSSGSNIIYKNTKEEMDKVIFGKKAIINAQHTLITVICYSIAQKNHLTFRAAAKLPIKNFISADEAYSYSAKVLDIIYTVKYKSPVGDEDYNLLKDWVSYLCSKEYELLERGIPVHNAPLMKAKLHEHIDYIIEAFEEYLSTTEDSFAIRLLYIIKNAKVDIMNYTEE